MTRYSTGVLEQLALRCRRLFLRDYEVRVHIGVHDFEKRGEQRVLVNVELWTPLVHSQPQHDQLREVLDYDVLRETVREVFAKGHVQLQETLCDQVLGQLFNDPRVVAARVSTQKPDVYPDCVSVGVEVMRVREGWLSGESVA